MMRIFFIFLACLSLMWSSPSLAADLTNGARVFEAQCVGCHIGGGNIVRRGKTLKLKVLQKNGLDSVGAIADLVTDGKNNMSAYRDRLSESDIADVAAYVLQQAHLNWSVQN